MIIIHARNKDSVIDNVSVVLAATGVTLQSRTIKVRQHLLNVTLKGPNVKYLSSGSNSLDPKSTVSYPS